MAAPPSPKSGPSGGIGTDSIALVTEFIKSHYLEIILAFILIYVGYQCVVIGSKYIFKPVYLVDPKRGTKRYIGRALHSKTILGDAGYKEFRSFIKDGFFRPVIPHLFVDMDRVNILSNAILLDFRSVVYDHKRRMFVGSLTGVKDMELDGLAVEERVKDKLKMIDTAVAMAVRGSASISQYNMMNNAIPLPDGLYSEDIKQLRGGRGSGLRPPMSIYEEPVEDHVDAVIETKARMKQRVVRKRPIPRPRSRPGPESEIIKRFDVGTSEKDVEWVEDKELQPEDEQPEDEQTESPPSFLDDIESMPIGKKFKGLIPVGDLEQDDGED